MENKNFALVLVAIVMLLVILGEQNERDALVERELYCEMIELWHNNDHLPPVQRPGWPPYKGECDE